MADEYPEVEAMYLGVEGATALIGGFKVDWNGGESGEAGPGDVIRFDSTSLPGNTPCWPLVIVTDGPNNDSGTPVRYVPGSGLVGQYYISGGPDSTDVTFTGTAPLQ